MGSYAMKKARLQSKGFTLIASLLLLLLLSGMAIGLMMMVNTEGKVGGTDLQNNLAFHAAEGGIEKMFSDLSTTINAVQAPTVAQICAINSLAPSITGVSFPYYMVQASGTSGTGSSATTVNCNSSASAQAGVTPSCPGQSTCWGQISAGPNTGLYAQVIPINMTVTASMLGGQEVSMMRNAQIALIPVFQFGVFCEADCSFFSNPTLDFAGRLHANGDLYLGVSNGATLTFHDKLEAYGNVITNNLPNTLPASSNNDSGTVYVASVSCAYPPPTNCGCPFPGKSESCGGWNCVQFPASDGSVSGMGVAPPASLDNTSFNIASYASSYNTAFNTFSTSVNHDLINGDYGNTTSGQVGTAAKKLTLPFVTGTQHDYELIRRPPDQYLAAAGVTDSAALSQSREYNLAQIHVLLSDDPNDLPGGASDSQNVRLANLTAAQVQAQSGVSTSAATQYLYGVPISSSNYNSTTWGSPTTGNNYTMYFASASNAVPIPSTCSGTSCTADWPYAPQVFAGASAKQGLQPWASGGLDAPTYLQNGTATISLCPPAGPYGTGVSPAIPANCPTTSTAYTNAPYPYYAPPNPNTPAATGNSPPLTYYNSTSSNAWSLIDGYLRVEYIDNSGVWHPVTQEWLQLGFARGVTPPTSPGTNPITPNAILLLQRPADRSTSTLSTSAIPIERAATGASAPSSCAVYTGTSCTTAAKAPTCTATSSGKCTAWTPGVPPILASDAGLNGQWAFGVTPTTTSTSTPQSLTQYNWYPINFYDAREGEPRDVATNQGNDSCTTIGVMNAVEIDVGNLQQWLANSTSGKNVNYTQQNGYVLYFSDRRGMLLNPHPPMNPTGGVSARSGDSGLEDVINPSSSSDTPNGSLDTAEDVNQNGYLDNFGTSNLGLGFWNDSATNLNTQIVAANPDNPFSPRITSCGVTGRKNWVSGARHALKLVDGSLGNLPTTPVQVSVNNVNFYGGFTVASENPVYIHGDYNSSSSDTFFSKEANGVPGTDNTSPAHVPAAVIADTVTFLSDNWNDDNSTILSPTQPGNPSNPNACPCNRGAGANTYYRVATAAGKTLTFPYPSWETNGSNYPEGTDGGIGNFLRFLEDWQDTPSTMHYGGSMVEMFYSTYNTGMFKCCTYSVYEPPNPRDYYFDPDFTSPQGLPPGTPMFRDVESLGYRQVLPARGLNNN